MAHDLNYQDLPSAVKDNLDEREWVEAQRDIVSEGTSVPETAIYINLKNGLCQEHRAGDTAEAPLLPTYDLSGGRGTDDTQFRTTPPGARRAHGEGR